MDSFIEKVKTFVRQETIDDNSGHDYLHALRVFNLALTILEHENANKKIVLTSALIHDLVDCKLYEDIDDRIRFVSKSLKKLDYQDFEINQILEIINYISFSKNVKLKSIEAQIVSDADKLDATGAIGIIRTIEYGACHKRKFYDISSVEKNKDINDTNVTLTHFYQKLLKLEDYMYTNMAKELCKERIEFMKKFLNQFYKEIELNE